MYIYIYEKNGRTSGYWIPCLSECQFDNWRILPIIDIVGRLS